MPSKKTQIEKYCLFFLIVIFQPLLASMAFAQVERIWLTHRSNEPDKIVVSWTTKNPGPSLVRYGSTEQYDREVGIEENTTLHHVEIPIPKRDTTYHYSVVTGKQTSKDATFKAYPSDVLRVAVVANWRGNPKLPGLIKDDVHLLLTAGDNIANMHRLCGPGNKECIRPYAELIDSCPALFRSTPFMPVLGNHDKEVSPRGPKPPAEPVYDINATAFRKFFALPGDEWKWRFDIPGFGIRFIALDLNHISDMGTTWQSCHPFDKNSLQYRWYTKLMEGSRPPLVVTIYNDQNAAVRATEDGLWTKMLRRGTIAITGFGYFAERAESDGFTFYNTSLNGKGDQYPDPRSKFLKRENSYLLLTFTRNPLKMTVELKALDGTVLDRQAF